MKEIKGNVLIIQKYKNKKCVLLDDDFRATLHLLFTNQSKIDSVSLSIPDSIHFSQIEAIYKFFDEHYDFDIEVFQMNYDKFQKNYKATIIDDIKDRFDVILNSCGVDIQSDKVIGDEYPTEKFISKQFVNFIIDSTKRSATYKTTKSKLYQFSNKAVIFYPYSLDDAGLVEIINKAKNSIIYCLNSEDDSIDNAKKLAEANNIKLIDNPFGSIDKVSEYYSILSLIADKSFYGMIVNYGNDTTSFVEQYHICKDGVLFDKHKPSDLEKFLY